MPLRICDGGIGGGRHAGDGACLQVTAQLRARAFGPERGHVHVVQRGQCRVQGHGLPRHDAGLHVGVHGLGGGLVGVLVLAIAIALALVFILGLLVVVFGGLGSDNGTGLRCGAGLGLDVDARLFGGERSVGLHLRGDGDLGFVLGHRVGHLQVALELRIDLHGACALQAQVGLVTAVGPAHLVHVQHMGAAVVCVVAGEAIDRGFRRAFPDDAIHLEGHVNLDRQRELLQRLGGLLGLGAGRALEAQFTDMHHAELERAREQRAQAPADLGVLHLHGHGGALPLQRADLAAAAYRSGDLARLQALAFGQKTRHALQRIGQRIVAARPPPAGAQRRDDYQHQGQQQPADATQQAAAQAFGLLAGRARRLGRRGVGGFRRLG
ncbi:hypothetical protein SDC9_103103 [bioreactor metagenome]|uniref:Uncharacterized protein n=1 Tax=bioreactor metagenome TaxID=1076179 RepID=A0A645AVG8_9ZZZZ